MTSSRFTPAARRAAETADTTDKSVPGVLPSQLVEYRPHLLRYALLEVGKKEVAEDIVQEVLLAALKGIDGFSGRSSIRTWLTAILVNKIADYWRVAFREVSIEAKEEAEGPESVEAMFRQNGSYVSAPQEWRDPESSLNDKRFFAALESCMGRLPDAGRRVFLLRELMGLSIEEICNQLDLSATNCSVLLHRARMRLRSCLESRWFAKPLSR